MRPEKDEVPADRIWIVVNDLNSAMKAWKKIQQDILNDSEKIEPNDFDEV